jgi:uncharacterized phage protein (TIGR01671 family)
MREILFRGKTANGDWVEGFPMVFTDNYMQICRPMEHSKTVIPATIGQFTGLTENGKKIFEGDIVQAERICNSDNWTGYVVFWNGCFALKGLKDGNVPAIDLFKNYKVIGNIHDNPELLEE